MRPPAALPHANSWSLMRREPSKPRAGVECLGWRRRGATTGCLTQGYLPITVPSADLSSRHLPGARLLTLPAARGHLRARETGFSF
jgi:hypothetical protein